jgi:hypothetical protein
VRERSEEGGESTSPPNLPPPARSPSLPTSTCLPPINPFKEHKIIQRRLTWFRQPQWWATSRGSAPSCTASSSASAATWGCTTQCSPTSAPLQQARALLRTTTASRHVSSMKGGATTTNSSTVYGRLYLGLGRRLGARGMWGRCRGWREVRGWRPEARSGMPKCATRTEVQGRKVRWRRLRARGGDSGDRGGGGTHEVGRGWWGR